VSNLLVFVFLELISSISASANAAIWEVVQGASCSQGWVPLANGATQQYAQIARSRRVLARRGAGRVALLANSSLLDASHALPAPLLARTHLTDIDEMSSTLLRGNYGMFQKRNKSVRFSIWMKYSAELM
jgi:hypothetical protein